MAQHRTQTISVVLPAGTPAGNYPFPGILDQTYKTAVGVTAYENQNGGIPFVRAAIEDDVTTYVSMTNIKHLQAGIDCPKPFRLTPLGFACNGATVKVNVNVPVPLVSPLNVDVVFTLER